MQIVRPPRAVRMLSVTLAVLFAILPPALALVPWVQNVQAQGRVTAFDPLDRIQLIPAPVTGRLVELNVQEGDWVQEGEILAEMEDQDPLYATRLEQQLEFAQIKVQASQDMIRVLEFQRDLQDAARTQAIAAAESDLSAAQAAVDVAEGELTGARAAEIQKRLDFERNQKLYDDATPLVSQLKFQEAELAYNEALAKVQMALAKVAEARQKVAAKRASVEQIRNEEAAKIEKIKSEVEKARQDLTGAQKEVNDATTKLERQNTQTIRANRSGYVQRVYAANTTELLSQGSPLIELIPDTGQLAVELYVRGIDAPLVNKGRHVRLQFEGWPAVQFAGWPSVAVGTFGGVVEFVDSHATRDGLFRVLILPDPADEPWPDRPQLRQGARASGWLLLNTVSIGYEIWRILNAFPPSLQTVPEGGTDADPSMSSAKGGTKSGK